MKIKRYNGLDFLKTIVALIVVWAHCKSTNDFFTYTLRELARIAVPIFFMISGFFAFSKSADYFKKSFIKMVKLQISSDILFLFFDLFKSILSKEALIEIFKSYLSFNAIVFNVNNVGWYLRCLIYIYGIIYLIKKYNIKLNCYKFIPFLSFIVIILDCITLKYSKFLFNISYSSSFYDPYTKFLIGIICFLIGVYLKYFFENNEFKNNILLIKLTILFFVFLICNLIEIFLLKHFDSNLLMCNYLFTIPLASVLFLIFANIDIDKNFISDIGLKYSCIIYIVHVIVLNVFNIIVIGLMHINNSFVAYTKFIFVFIGSLIFAIVYKKMVKLISAKKVSV